jgi:hypothetical protein
LLPIEKCLDGGIGRRARLKIWLSKGSAGSIPVRGTQSIIKAFKSLQIVDLRAFSFSLIARVFKDNQG